MAVGSMQKNRLERRIANQQRGIVASTLGPIDHTSDIQTPTTAATTPTKSGFLGIKSINPFQDKVLTKNPDDATAFVTGMLGGKGGDGTAKKKRHNVALPGTRRY